MEQRRKVLDAVTQAGMEEIVIIIDERNSFSLQKIQSILGL